MRRVDVAPTLIRRHFGTKCPLGICWMSPLVILGVSGLFYFVSNNVDPDLTPHHVASDLAGLRGDLVFPVCACCEVAFHVTQGAWVSGPEVIKLFPCSTQLSMEFFLLINVKMPTIVGILTFMSGKNSILGVSEPKKGQIS